MGERFPGPCSCGSWLRTLAAQPRAPNVGHTTPGESCLPWTRKGVQEKGRTPQGQRIWLPDEGLETLESCCPKTWASPLEGLEGVWGHKLWGSGRGVASQLGPSSPSTPLPPSLPNVLKAPGCARLELFWSWHGSRGRQTERRPPSTHSPPLVSRQHKNQPELFCSEVGWWTFWRKLHGFPEGPREKWPLSDTP